jgi:AcrR family transcriptional regulator
VLEQAILAATLEELAEVGYADLTMDRVAVRARTSKAALYRRWSNRAELVVDACRSQIITDAVPDTGELRADMIAYLRIMSDRMDSPFGAVVRGLLAEVLRRPELAEEIREQIFGSGPTAITTILERAVARGEVPERLLRSRRVTVAADLLRNEFLLYGGPVPDETIVEIVDDIYLPLMLVNEPGRSGGRRGSGPPGRGGR